MYSLGILGSCFEKMFFKAINLQSSNEVSWADHEPRGIVTCPPLAYVSALCPTMLALMAVAQVLYHKVWCNTKQASSSRIYCTQQVRQCIDLLATHTEATSCCDKLCCLHKQDMLHSFRQLRANSERLAHQMLLRRCPSFSTYSNDISPVSSRFCKNSSLCE